MDPEFREECDRSAFAREAAMRLVRCRVERGLTQAQLTRSVGLQQPVIARQERGTGIGAGASRDQGLLLDEIA